VLEDFRLIVDLVSVLAAAAAGGIIAGLVRQPPLLGYIVGGAIVGPTGLGLIKELVQVETLAQFGAAFLLFALGVEFSFSELKKVQNISLGGGGLQIVLTILITTFISVSVGWVTTPQQGVFLGAILSLSSTAVVLKSLMEANETATPHGQVMLGILVVQDLALGFMLAVLPALDRPPAEIGLAVTQAAIKIGLFAAGSIAIGIWLVPRLLRLLASTESRELFLLGIVSLCLGIALLTAKLGLSIEMGAFVAGLMISEVEYADQTLAYVEPIRDVFAALFFAAIGMLIDPLFLWNNLDLILGLVLIVCVGKFLIITPLVKLFGYSLKTALIAGLGLAQIGEFSFVLASEGRSLGLVSKRVYLLLLGTTAVTLVVTPFILRLIPSLFNWIETVPALDRWFKPTEQPDEVSVNVSDEQTPIVICGYGRTGQNLVTLLSEQNIPVIVVEQSEAAIQKLRDAGISYVYGNAVSIPVLTKAGLDRAQSMVIALPDAMSTRLCLKHALEISPDLDIVVRANQYKDIELLYQLGGSEVVQPEFEASLEMAAHLLVRSGLPTIQIQRQVKAIRNSHYLELRPQGMGEKLQNIQAATLGMNRRWYRLSLTSPLIGNSIASANIRTLTGATVVAIERENGAQINYPHGGTTFEIGDSCLVIGSVEEQTTFEQLTTGKIEIPVLPLPVEEKVIIE
jgi:CPA2 family monovalent cation:H+ antiporter-2